MKFQIFKYAFMKQSNDEIKVHFKRDSYIYFENKESLQ